MSLVLMGAPRAEAQLVRKTGAAKKQKQTVARQFSRLMGEALDQQLEPGAMKGQVPLALARLLAARYQGHNLERLMKKYEAIGAAFARRWEAYTARRAAVKAAVARAAGLSRAGKHDAARKALEAVITPVDLDQERGRIKRRPASLLVMDAELGALRALAELAARARTPRVLVDICTAYAGRRQVKDAASERLIWFAWKVGRRFGGLGAGQKSGASRAVSLAADAAYRQTLAGGFLARGFFESMGEYGLRQARPARRRSAKPGQWALFDLRSGAGALVTVTADRVTFKINRSWRIPYDCRETNKIDGINPVTGKVIYRKRCKHRVEKTKVSLKARLAAAPEPWAKERFARVWLLGKVKKAGPRWVLTDASIADLRHLFQ